MDLEIRIIQHNDFISLTPSGGIDLEQSKRLLLRLITLKVPHSNSDVLLDFRNTTTSMTIWDMTELVGLMIKHRNSFRNKLAILTQASPRLELAQFLGLYAGNRGFQVAAFDNFETAILWLATIVDVTQEDE